MMKTIVGIIWIMLVLISGCLGNPDAKRLYDDLLSNYNKLVRPSFNATDNLTVKIKLKLSQLIDVNLKNQVMTTNLWVEQSWHDYKLKWDPKEYGGVDMLHVPSDHIWRPDIVLYNNADGNFEVTLATKATLNYTGRVDWKPPAIYKSSCEIDVEYFPFDEQTCMMKFGSWTYDGFQVDLRHIDEGKNGNVKNSNGVVDIGFDLTEFYTSVEWDILEVPAVRHERFYTCCNEPYLDITFYITMRRKTLFYTVNLIIPCLGISFLTVLVFYLPCDSGEKVSLSVSILLSLTVFFLLLAEIIPPTSLVVPLLGKFVLFTMVMDTLSVWITVVVINVHYRSPQTHVMKPWVRRVFIQLLPRLLAMRRPEDIKPKKDKNLVTVEVGTDNHQRDRSSTSSTPEVVESSGPFLNEMRARGLEEINLESTCRIHGPQAATTSQLLTGESVNRICSTLKSWHQCPEIYRAIEGIRYIADHVKKEEDSNRIKEDWKYVAMVIDRLFLWIFLVTVIVGSAGIILQAPSLYDTRVPIDIQLSEISPDTARPPNFFPTP
ncbi:PREDICTED: acetylcholine receptor subunit alpha-like isoform X2 [Acromyrmex echinatior]|uniref:acetylcholine receptor subunit alpha-like isoform X2 n=1 Tax=Acromyrmex echinatior TaxID=103372 RepID=UPI000580D6EA|nr:PREDICTED: acetylcholine receptor subunit alpha-like isoform X2 [Acromyrmex echinatior]